MDKVVKIVLILAGIGVFWHFVIYLPGIERERQAREAAAEKGRQDREAVVQNAAVAEAAQRKGNYEACMIAARANYSVNWANSCKSNASRLSRDLQNCLANPQTTSTLGPAWCRQTYAAGDPSPECTLPKPTAESINAYHAREQEQCLAQAKSGL